MGPDPPEGLGMACSACYYLVISSTHMSNGHFRRVKGVFRGPLCATSTNDSPECAERALGCSAEDLKALFYCELCHKQYLRHQEFDNHINSYDHAHKQRLKELKHREFSRNVASKSWKDQRKQEKALRRLHKLAQLQQDSQRVPGRSPAMAVSQQRDRDMDQGDHRPLNHTQRPTPMQPMTVRLSQPPKDPYRSLSQTPLTTALEEHPLITLQASSAGPPAANAQPRLYLQVPLPGQERTGGRLGVSFCFSRRGPKLVPSASVFSDLEEEDREKREQMKERIRGIREDMDKEIGDVKERRPNKNKKVIPDNVAQSDLVPIPSEAARREEDTEKRDLVKEHSLSTLASGNHSSDQVFSPSKTHMTIWGSEIAQIDTEYKNGEPMRNQESEEAKVESQYMCVLSKDDSTCLKWPVSLLKFTKSQPHICYSCKPLCLISHQTKVVTEDVQGSQPNQICALSGESNPQVPPTLVSDAHTCLQRQTKQERGAHRPEKAAEDFKAEQYINVQTEEHLSLKNKNLSSSETRPERGGCTLNMENCVKTASHSFDPAHSNSSDPISQNPMGGRLRGARGIRERAIIALSCKSESVITSGTQGMCIRPSRCECGGETICEGASTPKTFVGASEVSCKKRKVSKKKPRLGKSNRGERKKASKKRQSARRKVRSVVSTVSTVRERNREAGGGWSGKKRHGEMRRRVQRTGSSCLLGRCKAEPVSVFVRKRKSHRSYSTESQSPTDRKQTQHCNGFSQLHRYSADRDTKVERGPDGDAVSSPWHSHFTLHSFSPGCNSKLFWGRGHHSNPRSFFNCCYPDKSCGSNLAKKRKLHGDKKLIYHKRNHLRHRDVWEGTEADRNTGGSAGYRDRGLISEKERPEWMRESCPRGWRSRSKAVEWSRLERLSPSPRRWGMRHRHLSTEDVDWDKCSMDRWTWGSSDSGDDRDTHRSRAGPRPVADIRGSPGFVLKCTKETKHPSLKHSSSPEWWPSRQAYSPYISMRASGSQSPRPCSPCSTSISELSWEWSRSSTCSGVTVDGLTVSSCRTSSVDPGPSTEVLQGTKKLSPTMSTLSDLNSCQLSQSLPHRPSFAPNATCINTYQCETSPTQQKQTHSQPDLGQGSSVDVTGNRSGTTAGPSPTKSVLQKSARMLLLPLIGKLPAIQRKARRDKWILGKLQEKRGEDEEGAKCSGQYSDIVTKCPLDIAESTSNSIPNLSPSQYTTDKRKTAVDAASPISFTAEEMDKYSRLQEKAREHMQKVLKNRQESADIDMETNYTHSAQANNCGTLEEHYTPGSLHNLSQPQTQSFHAETMQAQAQHTLQVNVPHRRVAQQELFTQRMLGVTDLPPLPPSPPLSSLCHIILQQTSLPLPPVSSSLSASSPSAAIHPQPAQLPHTLSPFQTSLPHHLHLSTYSITSLFPSILLSPHPISLLHQSPTFHATPIPRLSPVALQPLHPQPFMDRAWSVRFQQKAL